ncbi:MAG: serine protein kinase RIO [Candidatus Nitrosotenuis sp.]
MSEDDFSGIENIQDYESQFSKIFPKQKRRSPKDGFKKDKVVNQVLDKTTMFTLYEMINDKIIAYVNGIVKSGKESALFWAVDPQGNDVALKVYLTSTSNFKKRAPYIIGDPRFSHFKKGTRNMVYLWAQKEFKNLKQCAWHGLPVAKPLHVSKNVLAMEFVGKDGVPAKTLHETEVDENDYAQTIQIIGDLYKKAKLVHGDLSEYNIFKTENGLIVFDFGSAVDTMHPNAQNFLERDIKNMSYFFAKRGLIVANPADVMSKIVS